MKKLLMFLCCVFIAGQSMALDNNCEPQNKPNCWGANEYLNINGVIGCYECDNERCGANTVILAKNAGIGYSDSQGDELTMGWKMYTCYMSNGFMGIGAGDQWRRTDAEYCSQKDKQLAQTSSEATFDIMPDLGDGTEIRNSHGSIIGVIGGKHCLKVVCKHKELNGKCMSNEENACATGGGKWTGSECSCEHLGTDYAWNGKKCDKTKAAKEREANERRQQQQQASARAACVNTGGQWTNNTCICSAEKHLIDKVKGKTCDCADGYILENKVCVITDIEKLKQACDKSGVARWNDLTQKCVCNGTEPMLTFNFDTLRCEQDADYAACMVAKEKGIADWVNNECKCKKAGYDFINGECVESQESIDARNEADRQRRITESTAKISGLGDKLKDIMSAKLSVWKTAEGNFNGARLASDSIAGVVLGTAGGLITSTVVKKNQVKTGFEDVNCAVGGQNVAGWGDEFTVGIR